MKKYLALLLALAMVFALAACGGEGEAPATDAPASDVPASDAPTADARAAVGTELVTVEPGKLHMSTNAEFPPYEMIADDGSFEGIDIEVAGAIAEKLGLELVVDNKDFNTALLAVQNGQTDMAMAGITVTDERKEVMDFSDSYATGVQVVIVKADSPIQTIDDLDEARMIGCQKATTGYLYCSAPVDDPEAPGYGADHVTAYDTGALAVQALIDGRVDAVVIDNEPAKAYVAESEGLKILDTKFAVEDYAIGFAKGNDQLREAVNAAMAELKADGTFQRIVDKYITAD